MRRLVSISSKFVLNFRRLSINALKLSMSGSMPFWIKSASGSTFCSQDTHKKINHHEFHYEKKQPSNHHIRPLTSREEKSHRTVRSGCNSAPFEFSTQWLGKSICSYGGLPLMVTTSNGLHSSGDIYHGKMSKPKNDGHI